LPPLRSEQGDLRCSAPTPNAKRFRGVSIADSGNRSDVSSLLGRPGGISDLLKNTPPGPPPEREDHEIDYQAWFITRRPKEITSAAELWTAVRRSLRHDVRPWSKEQIDAAKSCASQIRLRLVLCSHVKEPANAYLQPSLPVENRDPVTRNRLMGGRNRFRQRPDTERVFNKQALKSKGRPWKIIH